MKPSVPYFMWIGLDFACSSTKQSLEINCESSDENIIDWSVNDVDIGDLSSCKLGDAIWPLNASSIVIERYPLF